MLINSNFASQTRWSIFTLGPQMHQATLVWTHTFFLITLGMHLGDQVIMKGYMVIMIGQYIYVVLYICGT